MNPRGVTEMLARMPIEKIKERLHIYEELSGKTAEDLMVQDMLNKELERRESHLVQFI
jgi:hypothetical protein